MTGSMGQIGTELLSLLRLRYGMENVFGSDIQKPGPTFPKGPFVFADVTNYDALGKGKGRDNNKNNTRIHAYMYTCILYSNQHVFLLD